MASKTKIYIVVEFVDGGELFDRIVRVVLWIYLICKPLVSISYGKIMNCADC